MIHPAEKTAEEKAKEEAAKKNSQDAAAKKMADNESKGEKKVEDKRQEGLSNHVTKPLLMLAQAGLKFMKNRQNLGKVGQVMHIKNLYYSTLDDLLEVGLQSACGEVRNRGCFLHP